MKKISTFAVFNAKEQLNNKFTVAIFMAITFVRICTASNNLGYQIPVGYGTCVLTCSLARMEGDSLFCIQYLNFHSQMPKNNENATRANNSSVASTPHGAKTVVSESLTVTPQTRAILTCLTSLNDHYEQTFTALRMTFHDETAYKRIQEDYLPAYKAMIGALNSFLLDIIEERLETDNLTEL